jgi:hypothetical protein
MKTVIVLAQKPLKDHGQELRKLQQSPVRYFATYSKITWYPKLLF